MTGGAGNGKSLFINVVLIARTELQTLCEDNQEGATVLLMAPTGCADKYIEEIPFTVHWASLSTTDKIQIYSLCL